MYLTSQKMFPKDNTVDKLKWNSAQGGNSIRSFWWPYKHNKKCYSYTT